MKQKSKLCGSQVMSVKPQRVQKKHLENVDAICVPGGFGIRGIEGKVGAL
jgi:CTP synthase (UTP-ammonia lyase)